MDRNADISSLVIKAFAKLKASLYYEKHNDLSLIKAFKYGTP